MNSNPPHPAASTSQPADAPRADGRISVAYFSFVFGLSALLALQASTHPATRWTLASGFGVLALVGGLAISRRARRGRRSGPWIALATLQLFTVTPELGLRSAGFENMSGIQFGYPHPEDFWRLELDDELFWKLPSDSPLGNSLGFFGPEPRMPKPPGELRLVMLGDSCSQQDHPFAWPEIVALELTRELGRAAECVNLALSGYSTHQGRIVAARWLAKLEPDWVLVDYGWNDHWLARGAIDSEKRPAIAFERIYRASSYLQALRKLLVASGALAADAALDARNRVPLDEYRANLVAIVAEARASGARAVLITAPSLHDRGVPQYLLDHHFQRDADSVLSEHREYNDAVRDLAAKLEVPLFDLDREFAARADRSELFLEDGIHFTEAGRVAVARAFMAFANSNGFFR